jgi:hypothetical protein
MLITLILRQADRLNIGARTGVRFRVKARLTRRPPYKSRGLLRMEAMDVVET